MFSCPTYLLGGQYTSLRQMMFQPNFRYHVRVNLSHWPCLGSWASSRLRTAHSIMLSGIRSIQTPIFRVCFYFVCPAEVIMFFFFASSWHGGSDRSTIPRIISSNNHIVHGSEAHVRAHRPTPRRAEFLQLFRWLAVQLQL